jgi:hypothetical protein
MAMPVISAAILAPTPCLDIDRFFIGSFLERRFEDEGLVGAAPLLLIIGGDEATAGFNPFQPFNRFTQFKSFKK